MPEKKVLSKFVWGEGDIQIEESDNKQSVKHHPGGKNHDQSTHGNWARGRAKEVERPFIFFDSVEEAKEWLYNNQSWAGFVEIDSGVNDEDIIVFAETLAELKAMGLPSIEDYHWDAWAEEGFTWRVSPYVEESGYTESKSLIEIGSNSFKMLERSQKRRLSKTIEHFESNLPLTEILAPEARSDLEKYKILRDNWDIADKRELHSVYYFPPDRVIEAIVRHEYGHFWHSWQNRSVSGRPEGIDDLFDFYGSGEKPTMEEFGVTYRARDTWDEAVAENFVLWSIGETDKISPRVTKKFDELLEWSKENE